jgi:hypothetical protein
MASSSRTLRSRKPATTPPPSNPDQVVQEESESIGVGRGKAAKGRVRGRGGRGRSRDRSRAERGHAQSYNSDGEYNDDEPDDDEFGGDQDAQEDPNGDPIPFVPEDEEVEGDEDKESAPEAKDKKGKGKVAAKPKATRQIGGRTSDNFQWHAGIQGKQAPLDTIEKMYHHLLHKLLDDKQFKAFLGSEKVLRVATMCSGTECPIIALELIEERK